MEDDRLLERMVRGDSQALGAVIDRYTAYVNTIVYHIIGQSMTREDIEETVSDVFAALWRSRKKVRAGKLKSWLSAAARNLALKKLRKAGFDAPLEEDLLLPSEEGPQDEVQRRELEHAVRKAVRDMGPPDTEIFLRHYYYCQSVETVAREMGLGLSAVKMRLKRGREKLRSALTKEV